MKKPRAKLARGFFSTLSELFSSFLRGASCLNRHVQVKKNKEQQNEAKTYIGQRGYVKNNLYPVAAVYDRRRSRNLLWRRRS